MESLHSNIYNLLNHASHEQFMSGIDWYNQARRFCEQISSDTGIPFISVCAVMAALSPMSPWDRNKIDCVELCNNNEEHRFTTFGANVSKAKRLLSMTDYSAIVDTLNGLKTISFFDNIYSPDSESVTVDSHMLAIAHGKKFSKAERPNLSKMIYHTIEDGVRLIADQFKLRPYELQAILWVTWRETV